MQRTKSIPFQILNTEPKSPPEATAAVWSVDDQVDSPIRVSFYETRDILWFSAFGPTPVSAADHSLGEWIEGLWEYDVAEFFVSRPDLSKYLEFNLSPTGAWWHCRLTKPRERDPIPCARPKVRCLASRDESGGLWCAAIGIEIDWLEKEIGSLDEGLWNANSIYYGGDLPIYGSWASLGEPQPDFHRPGDFVRREFVVER